MITTGNVSKNTFFSFVSKFEEKYLDLVLIFIFSILLLFVIDRFVLERLPGWDHFRSDADFVGRLHILKEALLQGTFSYITPAYDFGNYSYADPGQYLSPLFPVYWLALIASAKVVWSIRLIFLFFIGSLGTYLLIKRFTSHRAFSLAVSFFYIFFPAAWTLRYGTAWDSWIYFLPVFFELILRLSDEDKKILPMFVGVSFLSNTLNLYAYCLINNLLIIFLFAFFIHMFNKKSIASSMFFAIKLSIIYLLSGAFYILPLAYLTLHIGEYKSYFCEYMGLCSSEFWTLDSLINYFKSDIWYNFFRRGTRDLPFYTPLFLNISGICALFFASKCSFPPSTIRLLKTLVCMILILFASPFIIMLTPINKIFLVRIQLLIIPYLWMLLASISLYYFFEYIGKILVQIKNGFLHRIFTMTTLNRSSFIFFVLSVFLVYIYYSYPTPPQKIQLYAKIYTEALVVLMYIFAFSVVGKSKSIKNHTIIMIMGLFAAFGQKAYLEKAYSGSELNRSDSSLKLDAEDIRQSIQDGFGEYNNDHRRLFVSIGWDKRGRNWQLIAQTALQPLEGIKTLFTWNYSAHPYLFILRAGFDKGKLFRMQTNFTPCCESIVDVDHLIDLMGIKYIVSAHAPIKNTSPHLSFITSFYKKTYCTNFQNIATGAPSPEDKGLSGSFYLYEVKDPLKVAFFADSYEVHKRSTIYNLIINSQIPHPKTLLLEEDPNLSKEVDLSEKGNSVRIINEKDSEITLVTKSTHDRMLVLTYIYWPFWKAYVDGIRTDIYRAYGGFMSIKVPKGHHVVRFSYIPWDFYMGLVITFLTLIFSIAYSRLYRLKIRNH